MGFVHGDVEVEGSERIVLTVREELARRRLSRQWLADQARVSLSTLEKALSGRRPFTLATVVRLEDALGIGLRERSPGSESKAAGMFAPEEMGAYSRPSVRWLEGEYLTLRPSFGEPGALYAYLTTIEWDEGKGYLTFRERERVDQDFAQQGFVCFPHLSGHIYLVTNSEGQYRLVLLNRPSGGGALNGILTTLVTGRGAELTPAAAPILLLPRSRRSEPQLGLVRSGDPCYDDYRECVDGISRKGYAVFPT
jgi:transcriptional regulator with XRE-family HTH domain